MCSSTGCDRRSQGENAAGDASCIRHGALRRLCDAESRGKSDQGKKVPTGGGSSAYRCSAHGGAKTRCSIDGRRKQDQGRKIPVSVLGGRLEARCREHAPARYLFEFPSYRRFPLTYWGGWFLALPRYAALVQQWAYLERVFSERVIRRKRECKVRLTTKKGLMVQIPYVGMSLILLTPLYGRVKLYLPRTIDNEHVPAGVSLTIGQIGGAVGGA